MLRCSSPEVQAPAVLQDILKGMPLAAPFADLMVGTETSDDAAVCEIEIDPGAVAGIILFYDRQLYAGLGPVGFGLVLGRSKQKVNGLGRVT